MGINGATQELIGLPGTGRMLPGVTVDDESNLGLTGFAHHRAMGSYLGVPLTASGEMIGKLYLTEKAGGEYFPATRNSS